MKFLIFNTLCFAIFTLTANAHHLPEEYTAVHSEDPVEEPKLEDEPEELNFLNIFETVCTVKADKNISK